MAKKFSVTTPIYYVNDVPHIGHAYTTLAADVLTRYWREKIGKESVFFLTGTDEHGQKIAEAAKKENLSPKKYADLVAPRYQEAWKLLNIKPDYFIRTTNPKHEKIVQSLLQKIYKNGYIYKDTYKGLYCVGCEKFLTETDLIDGKCPLHSNKEPVYQEEENYFLKLGNLSKIILEKIKKGEYEIKPEKRKHEILSRLELGVEDVSISREGVSWGIPLPWDKKQTAYVWVDALINYYSATQFVAGKKKFWPIGLHLIGKDILWFHTVIWQALLFAAGLKELPKTIFAHGFFTINGQKMSKSLGNVFTPKQLVERYGVDGTRYLIISAYSFGEDGDISLERFDKKYNADLANGLGNLVARTVGLAGDLKLKTKNRKISPKVAKHVENYQFDKALSEIWQEIKRADVLINENKAWALKESQKEKIIKELKEIISQVTIDLKPFLPATTQKIENYSGKALFPRLK